MVASEQLRSPASVAPVSSVDEMRDRWRRFAREDALHYVASNRDGWDAEDFYAMGADRAAAVLEWARPRRGRMLEIGCGAGRMLVHFAPAFERVDGVDIAPEMLSAAAAAPLPENVSLSLVDGASLAPFGDAAFDFAFSLQVFQHVPDRDVIAAYLDEVARVLRPGGRAVLQFDSRPQPALRRLVLRLPDRLLPRDRRRYIRRYPVSPAWPADRAARAGLGLVGERGSGTDDHMVLLERRGS